MLHNGPRASLIVCTNPRSGSWLLCEGLEATRLAGRPREWFHEATEQAERTRFGLSPDDPGATVAYVNQLTTAGTTENGVFGVKFHYYQLEQLLGRLAAIGDQQEGGGQAPFAPRAPQNEPVSDGSRTSAIAPGNVVSSLFPNARYLWLTRRDKVRQAISYHRACETDGWWKIGGQQPPKRPGTTDEAEYDFAAISKLENLLLQNEARWQRFFQDAGIEPLVVTYEELAASYESVLRRVLAWLDVPEAATTPIARPRLEKQADATTEAWAERYLREHQLAGAHPPTMQAAVSPPRSAAASFVIHDNWKRWIGENKLAGTADGTIVDTLVRNGHDRAAAEAEVARAANDPYLQAGTWMAQRLKKTQSLVGVYRSLSSLHPEGDSVPRRPAVSRDEFLRSHYMANRPVILTGLMSSWSAMRRWTPEFLKGVLGAEEVEIMAGRSADPNYEINAYEHRKKVRFAEYIDRVTSGEVTNDYYLVANNAFFSRPAARKLLDDIVQFEEYLRPSTGENGVFFWLGPAGTVTPLHHDTSNIFMAQVWGRKQVKLIASSEMEFLYNDVGVFSPIDCERPDLERWPLYKRATILDVVLEPGEVLFIPVGWWHHVRALDVSLTISFTNFAFPNHFEWQMPQIRK